MAVTVTGFKVNKVHEEKTVVVPATTKTELVPTGEHQVSLKEPAYRRLGRVLLAAANGTAIPTGSQTDATLKAFVAEMGFTAANTRKQ